MARGKICLEVREHTPHPPGLPVLWWLVALKPQLSPNSPSLPRLLLSLQKHQLTHFLFSSQTRPPRHRLSRLHQSLLQTEVQPPEADRRLPRPRNLQAPPALPARAARLQNRRRAPAKDRRPGQASEAHQGPLDRTNRAAARDPARPTLCLPRRRAVVEDAALRDRSAGGRVCDNPVPALAAEAAAVGVVREHGDAGPAGGVFRHGDPAADPVCGDRVHGAARPVAVSELVRGCGVF